MRKAASAHRQSAFLPAALSAWLAFLAFDFLAHAVLLAPWWRATEAFWHPPELLFKMIPFAYASFAIYAVTLTWLLARLVAPHPAMLRSLGFGALAGLIFGLTSILGVYSVLPVPGSALIVWTASFGLESAAAAVAASIVLGADRPWRRLAFIFFAALALFVVGVALQNLLFPTPANRLSTFAFPPAPYAEFGLSV